MTPKMREALRLLREHGDTYRDDPSRYGVVTSASTHLSSGQPWINWRTAYALQRAGIATVDGYGEECEIIVPPDGGGRSERPGGDA